MELDSLDGAVFGDVELLEETLVDLPADGVRGRDVSHLTAFGCSEGSVEGGFDIGGGGLGDLDLTVGCSQVMGKSLHLGGKQVLRDSTGVVSLEELLALALDSLLDSASTF
ncbi:hypothetical protein [Labedaea rhizosphaerae]|uniref:hypothetical protein n=1 Tax=Labedaea rhizosphaerae TaxID=598644 RepID=UPI00105CDE02|nr:hypothetical protein [Labedaea rhizosphaerae]